MSADEAARRVGQDDGVVSGAPAVATEGLLESVAAGRTSLSAVLAPARGVYEAVDGKVARRCGGAARDVAATYVGRALDLERGGAALLAATTARWPPRPPGPWRRWAATRCAARCRWCPSSRAT